MQLRSRAAAPLPKPSWVLAWVPTVEFVDDELPEDACVGLPEAGGPGAEAKAGAVRFLWWGELPQAVVPRCCPSGAPEMGWVVAPG